MALKKSKNNDYNAILTKIQDGQLTNVNLSGIKLQKLPYQDLLQFLTTDKRVISLDLSKNELADEGAQAVAMLIRCNSTIGTIDLRNNKITTMGASHLLAALQETNYTITSLLLQEDTKGLDATFSKLFNLNEINPTIEFMCELNKGVIVCRNTKAQELRLCKRSLRLIPSFLTELYATQIRGSHLVRLDLSQNAFSTLPPSFLSGFPLLEILFLNENKITSLPNEINLLVKLKKLSIAKNGLTAIPESIALLGELTDLDIDNNQIGELPPILGSMKSLKKLRVAKNPFKGKNNKIPPEILKDGDAAILSYLRNALLSGTEKLDTMKLMFVGNGNVGKTTLLKNFMAKKNELEALRKERNVATDGIDIRKWVVDKDDDSFSANNGSTRVVFKAWDFAGQDVYYSTHQFFLSPQAVYILVFNIMNNEETNRIEYWLHSIRCRARKAPIILVGTHLDEAGIEVATAYMTKVNRFRQQHPNIKLVSAISLTAIGFEIQFVIALVTRRSQGDGVKELKDALVGLARQQDWYMKEIPRNYLSVQRKLETFKANRPEPLIDFKHFYQLCIDCEVPHSDVRHVVEYLSNSGDIVYFKDRSSSLAEVVILDPEWLARMFATIITMKPNFVRDGVISLSHLRQLWGGVPAANASQKDALTPENLQQMLLSLFQRFELLHRLNENEIIVPSLLPAERPSNAASISWSGALPGQAMELHRSYKLDLIPTCFFSRIFVRLLIKGWTAISFYRNGFFMQKAETLFALDVEKTVVRTLMKTSQPQFTFGDSLMFYYSIPDMIEAWLADMRVDVELPCSLCTSEIRITENGQPKRMVNPLCRAAWDALANVHTYSWESIEEAFQTKKTSVQCKAHAGKEISLESLAPDITLAGIKRLEFVSFSEKSPLGKGSFATVWKGKYSDGSIYAVKQLVRGDASDSKPLVSWKRGSGMTEDAPSGHVLYEFRREARMMQAAKHPNIVAMLGVCVGPLCIAMELMNAGALDKYIRNPVHGRLHWSIRMKLALDIAEGMNFLHHSTPPIIHRDLKSPNVLLSSTEDGVLTAKVADVGLAHSLEIQTELRARVVDNPTWLAPEILLGAPYSEKADVYSFGVILWELWAQKPFFVEEGGFWSAIERHVVNGKRPAMPGDVMPEWKLLVRNCWHQAPRERATFDSALRDLKALNAKWTAEPPQLPVIVETPSEPGHERRGTTSENFTANNSLFDRSQGSGGSKGQASMNSYGMGNYSRERTGTGSMANSAAGGMSLKGSLSHQASSSSFSSSHTSSHGSDGKLHVVSSEGTREGTKKERDRDGTKKDEKKEDKSTETKSQAGDGTKKDRDRDGTKKDKEKKEKKEGKKP